MILESSRYVNQKIRDAVTGAGQVVKVLTLRLPPLVRGKLTQVKDNDRLDIMAQRLYKNPTMFWHIADANTELEANDLVKRSGRSISVPEQ